MCIVSAALGHQGAPPLREALRRAIDVASQSLNLFSSDSDGDAWVNEGQKPQKQQQQPRSPAFWNLAFIAVNLRRLTQLVLAEQTCITLDADEQKLYESAFAPYGVTLRDFSTLLREASSQWREFEANEVILKEGDPMPLLYYVVDGEVEVTRYGDLAEIWFDGGFKVGGPKFEAGLLSLLNRTQPHAAVFNGCGLSPNAVAWIGTESGHAPYPVWNTQTGCPSGAGAPPLEH